MEQLRDLETLNNRLHFEVPNEVPNELQMKFQNFILKISYEQHLYIQQIN